MCRALCSNIESEQDRCQSTIFTTSCTTWVQHDRYVSVSYLYVKLVRERNEYSVSCYCFGWLEIPSGRILHVMKFLNVCTESKLF